MITKKTLFASAFALFAAGSLGTTALAQRAADAKLLEPSNIDRAVKPGDNFYMFANGSWLKNNPIPPSETRWGSFNELQENNYRALHSLLDEAASKRDAAYGSKEQKIGEFYRSGMDSAMIEKMGLKPLQADLDRISKINSPKEILAEVCYEQIHGAGTLFSFYVSPDDKNVSQQICQFFQGGLGMPDRDYYFKTDERSTKIRDAYQNYLITMFRMIDGSDPKMVKENATNVFELERILAENSMTRVEMRDPYKLYNKFDTRTLSEKTRLDVKFILDQLQVRNQDSCIVGQPEFFAMTGTLLEKMPAKTWQAYLKFHLVNSMAPYLSSRFDNLRFDFYGRTLRGQQEQKPRWKRVLGVIDGSLGEVLGQMYVDKNFKPEAKKSMLELVNNLQKTYADRIQRLDWMSAATKKEALRKLNTFMKKIGYPDKWRDYSKLQIVKGDFVANIMASSAFEYQYNINKLGHPVDRTEWGMTPPTVNAYYNPAFNEIVFPGRHSPVSVLRV